MHTCGKDPVLYNANQIYSNLSIYVAGFDETILAFIRRVTTLALRLPLKGIYA